MKSFAEHLNQQAEPCAMADTKPTEQSLADRIFILERELTNACGRIEYFNRSISRAEEVFHTLVGQTGCIVDIHLRDDDLVADRE